MGQLVELSGDAVAAAGYLAAPDAKGPGVIVIQEWWGLVDHIKDVADRLADEGFVALAPDLYQGRTTKEPDEAQKLMMQMNIAEAGKTMAAAFDYLEVNPMVEGGIGSVGFCMGGAMSLYLATIRPVGAAVSFYGLPTQEPDWSAVSGPAMIHVAEHDDWVSMDKAEEVAGKIRGHGQDVETFLYPGTEHAFFNDERPEVHVKDAAELAWSRTLDFYRKHLR